MNVKNIRLHIVYQYKRPTIHRVLAYTAQSGM